MAFATNLADQLQHREGTPIRPKGCALHPLSDVLQLYYTTNTLFVRTSTASSCRTMCPSLPRLVPFARFFSCTMAVCRPASAVHPAWLYNITASRDRSDTRTHRDLRNSGSPADNVGFGVDARCEGISLYAPAQEKTPHDTTSAQGCGLYVAQRSCKTANHQARPRHRNRRCEGVQGKT